NHLKQMLTVSKSASNIQYLVTNNTATRPSSITATARCRWRRSGLTSLGGLPPARGWALDDHLQVQGGDRPDAGGRVNPGRGAAALAGHGRARHHTPRAGSGGRPLYP